MQHQDQEVVSVYLSLGSNQGNSPKRVTDALNSLSKSYPEAFQHSALYLTSPVGSGVLGNFVNAACSFKTAIDPKTLFHQLESIEKNLGKISKPKLSPRPIDIDLILYGSLSYQDATLTIPHPHWLERLFVLVPLSELLSSILLHREEGTIFISIKEQIQKAQALYPDQLIRRLDSESHV